MAEFSDLQTFTLEAAADFRVKQYHLVRASAAKTCNQASLSTNSGLVGVLQNKPNTGQKATIGYLGKTKLVAGGSITVNALLTTNSSGRATACASGDMAFGRALEAAGADGDIITALIFPPLRWAGAI